MIRSTVTIGLACLVTSGCLSVASEVACAYSRCTLPPEVGDAIWAADEAIIDGLVSSEYPVWTRTSITGAVRDSSGPVTRAKVHLQRGFEPLATRTSGPDGHYVLDVMVPPEACGGLYVSFEHPDGRVSEPTQVGACEATFDHDFGAG